MKIKKGFMLREVAGNSVVVAVGEASRSFNGLINLNETGVLLWKKLEDGATEEELVSAVTAEYLIDITTAERDVHAFVQKCLGAGVVEE